MGVGQVLGIAGLVAATAVVAGVARLPDDAARQKSVALLGFVLISLGVLAQACIHLATDASGWDAFAATAASVGVVYGLLLLRRSRSS